jgi:hypothetical protein
VNNFKNFVETVCQWIKVKIFPRVVKSYVGGDGFGAATVNINDLAVNVIRAWGEVFCGFGAYSIQEVFFCAGELCHFNNKFPPELSLTGHSGLSPFLTTLEVFTNPSRVARLLLAMREFAKFEVEDLWYVSSQQ